MKDVTLFGSGIEIKDGRVSFGLGDLGLSDAKASESAELILFGLCLMACEAMKTVPAGERPKHTALSYSPVFNTAEGTVQHQFSLRFTTPHTVNVGAAK